MIALSVWIGTYSLSWETYGTTIQSVACLLFGVFLVVVPVKLFQITVRDFNSLEGEEMQQQYGSFYDDLQLAAGKAVLL